MGLGTSPAFVPRAGCVAQVAALALTIGHYVLTNSAWAEQTKPVRPLSREETMLPRARPEAVPAQRAGNGAAAILDGAELPENFRELARQSGEPQIPGLTIIYLHPLGLPGDAVQWQNIIVHQTEGPVGSAKSMALAQATKSMRIIGSTLRIAATARDASWRRLRASSATNRVKRRAVSSEYANEW